MNNYLILPYSIIQLQDLSASEKILLTQLINLSDSDGVSFASNGYLAQRIGVSERYAAKLIKDLNEKDYIFCEKQGRKRYVTLNRKKLNDEECSLINSELRSVKGELCSETNELCSETDEKSAQYKYNYNNKYKYNYNKQNSKNNFSERKSSYNLEELMVIR